MKTKVATVRIMFEMEPGGPEISLEEWMEWVRGALADKKRSDYGARAHADFKVIDAMLIDRE